MKNLPLAMLLLVFLVVFTFGCAQTRVGKQGAVSLRSRERVHFDFDRAKVREADRQTLEAVALSLKAQPKVVAIVEGHADRTGSAYYNEILAEQRARAVRVYLRDLGADHRQVTLTSKGEREPLDRRWTREAHAKNRRVEILMSLIGE